MDNKEIKNIAIIIAILSLLIEVTIIGYLFTTYYIGLDAFIAMILIGIVNFGLFVALLINRKIKKIRLVCSLLVINVLITITYCGVFIFLLNALSLFFAH